MDSFTLKRSAFKFCLAVTAVLFAAWRWWYGGAILEDAFITFRVIDNFVNGFGLRWNIAERVPVFTHPLWLFLLTPFYLITRDVVFTTFTVSLACTALLILTLYRSSLFSSTVPVSLLLIYLSLTETFTAFSSSGFENPLTHLLLAGLALTVMQQAQDAHRVRWVLFMASLIMLNRLDLAPLIGPAVFYAVKKNRPSFTTVFICFGTLIFWEFFSLFYYGVLIPNTALAKIPYGVSNVARIKQGVLYLLDLVRFDPLACFVLLIAVTGAMLRIRDVSVRKIRNIFEEPYFPLCLGVTLQCLYVIWIGGDYIAYRFWSPAVTLAAIASFCHYSQSKNWNRKFTTSFFALTCILCPIPYLAANRPIKDYTGITDDRNIPLFKKLTLRHLTTSGEPLNHAWIDRGRKLRSDEEIRQDRVAPLIVTEWAVGMVGYSAGPMVHIIDPLALCDPLLARLPTTGKWRIGHFSRTIPPSYREWLAGDTHVILDPILAEFLPVMYLVTRAPLLQRERLSVIFPYALGRYSWELRSYPKASL